MGEVSRLYEYLEFILIAKDVVSFRNFWNRYQNKSIGGYLTSNNKNGKKQDQGLPNTYTHPPHSPPFFVFNIKSSHH